MKNQLLLLALFFSTFFIQAQDSEFKSDKKFDFGIRHGYMDFYSRATTKFENGRSTESYNELNLYLGVFAVQSISEKFRLRLEANYSPQAQVEIPLLLKYNVSERFSVYGGVQLDFSPGYGSSNRAWRDKTFGASLVLGLEYKINKHWSVEARYTHGLTNQYRIFNSFDADPVFGKKRNFSLGIIYRF